MTLKKAIDFVYSFYNETLPLLSEDMHDREFRDPKYTRELIEKAGIKIDRGKNIIVVGSKGKGTTSALLAEILQSQGYKVGLFTSPHLERFTERVKINGEEISERQMIKYLLDLEPTAKEIAPKIPKPYYLGPNGIFLALAMSYFDDNETDYNILESGRGGEYDDVFQLGNHVILTPMVLEHKYRLGPTLRDVIKTKTSVVDKECKNVVISKQDQKVYGEILGHLPSNVDVFTYGKDHELVEQYVKDYESVFRVNSLGSTLDVSLPSLAEYIGINLSSAVTMAKLIIDRKLDISKLTSLKDIYFNGRCEIIDHKPITVLDGMICRESASYVVEAIKKLNMTIGKKVAIVAIPKDKDYLGVVQVLSSYFDTLIFTKSIGAQYPFFQESVHPSTLGIESTILITESLDEGLEEANRLNPELVGVFGTQSLIGEARKKYKKITKNL